MEDEVCIYQKYGFCKYKSNCLKRHLDKECKDLNNCKSKKSCNKRHPKLCKRYLQQNNCSLGDTCEYLHKEKEINQEEEKLKCRIEELEQVVKEKSAAERKMEHAVTKLEKVVKAMTCKVLYLEEEVLNIKETILIM